MIAFDILNGGYDQKASLRSFLLSIFTIVLLESESGNTTLFTSPVANIPLCSSQSPIVGKWVDLGDELLASNPPCCRTGRILQEGEEKFRCTVNSFGSKEGFQGGSDIIIPGLGYGIDDCARCPDEKLRNISRYEWIPSNCVLPAWNSDEFCSALGNRTILFIGDSTVRQLAVAVNNYISWNGGDCGKQISYDLSDTLIGKSFGVANRGSTWLSILDRQTEFPDIVVLGAGSHVSSSYGTAGMVEILETVRNQYDDLYQSHPFQLVWRTSLGGGCLVKGTDQIPLSNMPRNVPGYWEYINKTQRIYNYNLMEEWDAMAIKFWNSHPLITTLDLTMLWMRPDSMKSSGEVDPLDCAHSCNPGALRVAARQMLLLLLTEITLI